MARRKPFDNYRPTTKAERVAERIKLRKMQKTQKFDDWLIKTCHLQRNECYYCDEQISYPDRECYHIDHRVPVYYGGESDYYNLCLACPSCNRTKGTQQLVRDKAFLKRMQVNQRTPVIYL
jgi:5-methylcytosine-specific restriction endonuclease McrA